MTSREPYSAVVRAVAVADGTISRIATQSVSPGRPSKGRSTKSEEGFLAMRRVYPRAARDLSGR